MSGAVGSPLPRQRLVNIQILRGVAATLVVLAHSIDASESLDGDWGIKHAGYIENFGAFGVDLFFIISGFVMAFSVAGRNGSRDAGDFLARRWIRIAPPYILASLLPFAIATVRHEGSSWRSIANLFLFVPIFDTTGYTNPPLNIGWTLSFEFTFYLFIALMLLTGLGRRIGWLAPGLVLLVAAGALIPDRPFLVTWLTNPIYLEFALGICAYLAYSRGLLQRARPLWLALGAAGVAALIVELVVGYGQVSEFNNIADGALSVQRVALWGIPAFMIFLGAVAIPERDPSRIQNGWRHLGDGSYSVYLIHHPVLFMLTVVLHRLPFKTPGLAIVVLGVLVGVGAGMLFYRFVERPVTRLLTARYKSHAVSRPAPA